MKNFSSSLVMSYLNLRKMIGLLGISLPFVLLFGNLILFKTKMIEKSISAYYHTGMGDFFVGSLFAIGAFLFSYRGYEKKDNIAGYLACIFAIGVALFPTARLINPSQVDIVVGTVHLIFAVLFFFILAYFCLFLFTKTNPKKTPTDEKLKRNNIYRLCGYVILISIGLMFFIELFLPSNIEQFLNEYCPIFWLESLAILAFGFSWLVKGEAIFADHKK